MKIKYIGSKDEKPDNVADTGLVWQQGETLEVEDMAAARKLLRHAGVWVEDTESPSEAPKPKASVDLQPVRGKPGPKPKAPPVDEGPGALPNLVQMESAQLVTLAKTRYGVDLEEQDNDALRQRIVGLENGVGPRGA